MPECHAEKFVVKRTFNASLAQHITARHRRPKVAAAEADAKTGTPQARQNRLCSGTLVEQERQRGILSYYTPPLIPAFHQKRLWCKVGFRMAAS